MTPRGDCCARSSEKKGLPERPGRQPEEAGLAGYMVETLEAFPDATMAEVIDARAVLRAPLVGFRSAMASMAHELESAPWDWEFQAEARALPSRCRPRSSWKP